MGKQTTAAECGLNFSVVDISSGRYRCTRPPYHRGPHYDGHQQYFWGHLDPEKDPATRQLWQYRRAQEQHEADKLAKRRKRRKLWGLA
jgi:hypothetical protein